MRSEFVYQPRRRKPSFPANKSSEIHHFLTQNSAPIKYDGPQRGKFNKFWFKFRNPELKEEIEAAEGPELTPTQTPDTTPEPKEIPREESD